MRKACFVCLVAFFPNSAWIAATSAANKTKEQIPQQTTTPSGPEAELELELKWLEDLEECEDEERDEEELRDEDDEPPL